MLKAATWLAALHWLSRGLSIISLVILARILTPEDFGVAALAMVSLNALEVIGGFGFDLSLIKDRKPDRNDFNTVFTLSIIRNSVIAALLVLGADLFASFFEDERLAMVLRVLACAVFLEGFRNVGFVEYRKELQYSKEFTLGFSASLCQFFTTLVLALLLKSYWALVTGVMAGRILRVFLSYTMHPYRPRPSLSRWRHIMRFSGWLAAGNVVNFVYNQFPVMILGKTISKHSLGVFHVGREMATFPTVRVIAPVLQVIFPGLSKISEDRGLTGRAVKEVMAIIAFFAIPAALGLSFVAPEAVPVFLGIGWSEAVPVIQILAIYGLLRVWQFYPEMIFMAHDKTYLILHMRLVGAVVQVIGVSLAVTYWGVLGACYAMVFAASVAAIAASYTSARVVSLRAVDFLRAIWRPVLGSTAMIGALAVWRSVSAGSFLSEYQVLGLVLIVLLGVSTYLLAHSIVSLLVKSDLETDVMRAFVFPRLPLMRKLSG